MHLFKIALFACFLTAACSPSGNDQHEYANFFTLDRRSQIIRFSNMSIDQKYRVMLYGNQINHPPALYLIEELARSGEYVIPTFRKELRGGVDGITLRDILAVMNEMERLRTYNVGADKDLIHLLSVSVRADNGTWADTNKKLYATILSNTGAAY